MYDFDTPINRIGINAYATDLFRKNLLHVAADAPLSYKDEDFIPMWVADMSFAAPDFITKRITKALENNFLGYTEMHAPINPRYRQLFDGWCQRQYDWCFSKEELFLSTGIVPALRELIGMITKADEKVLILTPSYPPFKGSALYNSRECVYCPLIDNNGYYTIDFELLEKQAADEKTTLLLFCNPHNPSGRLWSKDELKQVADIVKEHNLWVISDEIHCDLLRSGLKHLPLAKVMADYDRLVSCVTPSKTFNLGGILLANILIRSPWLQKEWQSLHYFADNPLSIAAAEAAYEHGDEYVRELRQYLDDNFAFAADFIKEHLPKTKLRIPQATYLAWLDLRGYREPQEGWTDFFAYKAGVLLEDGKMFVGNGDGYVRINIACPRSVVQEALTRMAKVLNTPCAPKGAYEAGTKRQFRQKIIR